MSAAEPPLPPVEALEQVAFQLEASLAPTYRVRAFRTAARTLRALPPGELEQRAAAGSLRQLPGVGEATERVVLEALAGQVPGYLARVRSEAGEQPASTLGGGAPPDAAAVALRAALRGDCHSHSDWSDGGSPIEEMALAARSLGHDYLVLTDHSPRLTVARGLSPERLREQLDVVAALNERLSPFRVLTGIEVDINADGSLDQEPLLLDRLDLVVASVHSGLRSPAEQMTARMLRAIRDPRTDVLGHCTGRNVTSGGRSGRTRPESHFDAEAVFAACAEHDVAVEVNCRPERRDPPSRLLRLAVAAGCRFSIDTDAHAPGQLGWQLSGCERAVRCGVTADRVINVRSADGLTSWAAARHG